MALSAFDNKSHSPGPEALTTMLGRSARFWSLLIEAVCVRHAPIEPVWNFGGEKYGWTLRLRRKDRNLLYLIPQKRQFLVGMALGEKAVTMAQQSGLPDSVLDVIAAAPRYAEGRGIRLPVKTKAAMESVLELTRIKADR